MTAKGAIYSFINFEQAARFGHVGWGFELQDGSYYFGSTDHLWKHDWWDIPAWVRYMNVAPHGDIDWWAERGSKNDMLQTMKSGKHIRYHAFKEVILDEIVPEQAVATAEKLKTGGWHLSQHNCVHQSFLVFSNYSKQHNLPDPFADPLNMIPKNWFARISGSEQFL